MQRLTIKAELLDLHASANYWNQFLTYPPFETAQSN